MRTEDTNLKLFAGNLAEAIERYGELPEDGLLALQVRQFKRLTGLEAEFRQTLIRSPYGRDTYEAFVRHICEERGNILTVRPFFRERQEVCIGPISAALKARHVQSLYQYDFNYQFVAYVMKLRPWGPQSKLRQLARQIKATRNEIMVMNMPLAISQARIFWSKAPQKTQDTRFSFMDFVQLAADGLMSAVDKFVIPAGVDENPELLRVWRAVAIGRMKGNFIEAFSETQIHFFPQDKRKLYRANKHLKDFNGQVDFEKLAGLVNTDLNGAGHTTASELAELMGAAAVATSTDVEETEDGHSVTERHAASPDWRPDNRFEKAQVNHALKAAYMTLSMTERKLLRMRGVQVDAI